MKTAHNATWVDRRSRPVLARLGAWKYGLLAASVFLSLLLVRTEAADKEPGKGEYWRSVERVRGRVWIETRAGKNERNEYSHDTWDSTESVQVDFTLERVHRKEPEMPPGLTPEIVAYMRGQWAKEEAASDIVIWKAAPGSVKVAMVSFQTNDSFHFPIEKRFTTVAEVNGVNLHELALDLKVETGKWQLVSPGKLRDKYRIVLTGTERDVPTKQSTNLDQSWEFDVVDSVVFNGTLAGKPGPVYGADTLEQGGSPGNPTHQSKRLGRIEFWPEFVDAKVEVTIDGYAQWRPEGSITKPSEPGNHLVARGTLVPKAGGRVESLPKIKKFRFELLETSSEPGVCLNWPLGAKDSDYDLRLASAGPLLQGQLSKKDQTNEFSQYLVDEKKQPYVETQIDSYDFGGKATLRVICELADGRELVGEMKGEGGGESLIILPKMSHPGWIADSWRKEKKIESLSENDDNEKVDGQKDNGDGFTLYEEYRGWVEKGKHIEGDPVRKDLFILNQIGAGGAAAIGGIKLFERVSKLITHHRLSDVEMSTTARLMNGNRRDAPQNKAQHGVWMYNADGTGIPAGGTEGMTSEDAGRAFRPGRVKHVVIESPGINDAIFGHDRSVGDYKLSERDAAFAYDRAVAHELLHAVGVDHHGEGETSSMFFFVSASDPNNPSHRAGFSRTLPNIYDNIDLTRSPDHVYNANELHRKLETLIWEDTKRSIAEELAPLYERKLAAERARRAANPPTGENDTGRRATQFPQFGKSEFYWRETDIHDAVAYNNAEFAVFATICELNDADSGNELCLMRYYFATAYPVKDQPNTYYVVRPGQNHAGRSICHAPAGTGANAHSHLPQSRFGDSAPNRGNCFGDICPNDAIPPRNLY